MTPDGLLKSTRSAAGAALPLAVGAGVARGLLAVAFAWLLSGIVEAAAFRGADLPALAGPMQALAGVILLRAALAWVADRAAVRAAACVQNRLFSDLLDHIRALGPVRLADRPTGEWVAVLADAAAAIAPYWRRWIPALSASAVIPFAILAAIAPVDWIAASVFAATLPLAVVFLIFVGQGAQRASDRAWVNLTRLGGHLLDAVQGLTDLKLFSAEKREIEIVARMAEAYRRDTMAVLRLAFLSALVLEFFATVAIALTAILVGFRLMWGEIGFHAGFFVLLLAPEFYAPIRALGAERHGKMEAAAAAERIAELFSRPAPPRPSHPTPRDSQGAVRLRFEGVSVTYGDGPPALDDITLDIAPGEHIALVGPSGGGKSTMFSVLLGFVEAQRGRVLIDGVPLDRLDPDAWRAQIAHVPQRPHLFDGDVFDNIAMGRTPVQGDVEAAVERALVAARADSLVARLPQGARTRLGENGFGLSGGEAQRLALARAFFAPGPLVLFDEPTAHLDPANESALSQAIAELAAERTMITIAHRLTTLRHHRILVLDRGRIVECGAYDDLVAAGGLFARMTSRGPAAGKAAEAAR